MNHRKWFLLLIMGISLQLSAASPWVGGYRASLDGFSNLPDTEYLGAYLFIEPLQGRPASPHISAGLLAPVFSKTPFQGIYLDIHCGITLFHFQDHPFDSLFLRRSTLAPRIQAGMLASLQEISTPLISLEIQPLSFFFGNRTVSVLGVRMLMDPWESQASWGVRIFDIGYYIF